MTKVFLFLYNIIFVPLLYVTVRVVGLFNAKFRVGLAGRRNWIVKLRENLKDSDSKYPRLWMHCSSAGEYEQGRPVIKGFLESHPDGLVVVSFFSPSGYEHITMPDGVVKTYLPLDSATNAKRFVRAIRPTIACTIRHDIWPNFQFTLKKFNIPAVLVDASISDEKKKLYAAFQPIVKPLFLTFTKVLAISEPQKARFEKIYPRPDRIQVTGDTRYDQVNLRAHELDRISDLVESRYFAKDRTIVVGSSWPSDEKHLLPALCKVLAEFPNGRVVLVPHQLEPSHLADLDDYFLQHGVKAIRYSERNSPESWDFQVLIVDAFGLLANLYALGMVAYVGGGFGLGVNSVLEPAAHGCWVIFGPRHLNVAEAKKLIEYGGATAIHDQDDIYSEFRTFYLNPDTVVQKGQNAKKMVLENLGASRLALDAIDKLIERG